MIKKVRADKSKNEKTSFGINDSKSIKNTDTAEEKGYDAGKKVSGIKLHIIVDTLGLPHAIHVICVNVTDRKGALDMISLHLKDLSSVSKFLVDGGDSGDNFADTVEEIHGADAQVAKKNELHKFRVLPKRFLVERTFGWLEKNVAFGKIVKESFNRHFKCPCLPLFLFSSEDFRQAFMNLSTSQCYFLKSGYFFNLCCDSFSERLIVLNKNYGWLKF